MSSDSACPLMMSDKISAFHSTLGLSGSSVQLKRVMLDESMPRASQESHSSCFRFLPWFSKLPVANLTMMQVLINFRLY